MVDNDNLRDDVNRFSPASAGKQPCPLAGRFQIESVQFGSHPVINDAAYPFDNTVQWKRGRVQPDAAGAADRGPEEVQSPVCLVRSTEGRETRVVLRPKFRVIERPAGATASVVGVARDLAGLTWRGQGQLSQEGRLLRTEKLTSEGALPKHVTCREPLTIAWQVNGVPAGESDHLFYVLLGKPLSDLFWTLLHVACNGAADLDDPDRVMHAVYSAFGTRSIVRKRDGKLLGYHRGERVSTNLSRMLGEANANGTCLAWSQALLSAWRMHGIRRGKLLLMAPDRGMLKINEDFPVRLFVKDIPGQGTDKPRRGHPSHYVVEVDSDIFDPSYGTEPSAGRSAYVAGAFDGFCVPVEGGGGYAPLAWGPVTEDLLTFQAEEYC